jgi:hypothetical protein
MAPLQGADLQARAHLKNAQSPMNTAIAQEPDGHLFLRGGAKPPFPQTDDLLAPER